MSRMSLEEAKTLLERNCYTVTKTSEGYEIYTEIRNKTLKCKNGYEVVKWAKELTIVPETSALENDSIDINKMLAEEIEKYNRVSSWPLRNIRPVVTLSKSTSYYGQTRYHGTECEIAISESYLKYGDVEDIRQTVMHEICHCAWHADDVHGKHWREVVKEVNEALGYHISRTGTANHISSSGKEDPLLRGRSEKSKGHGYKVTCKHCGETWTYSRRAKIVDRPQRYICNKCRTMGQWDIERI